MGTEAEGTESGSEKKRVVIGGIIVRDPAH
jgi:hypothetical protein